MSASKSIVSEMLQGLRLNGNNYDHWHRKIKYLLSENDSIEFIEREVAPKIPGDFKDEERFKAETKKDSSARYLMFSFMSDDLVHLFEGLKTAKAVWDAIESKYGILSPTRIRTLELRLAKLKCANNKSMDKHLLTLNSIFSTLHKAKQPYSDERKRLTLLNSLPASPEWDQMRFKGMHDFDSYEKCLTAVEFEAERLRDLATEKSVSESNFVHSKPKAKNENTSKKRKDVPKVGTGSEGKPSTSVGQKKKPHQAKKKKAKKAAVKCFNCGKPGHFA